MRVPFPDAIFAWIFYLALVGITLVASYTDLRTLRIPNWLTVPGLALGVLANLTRGTWIGSVGSGELVQGVWVLGEQGPWIGALDGLLFALAGFVAGFSLFFVMWILGTCRAGDLKLFAALGAWVGPALAIVLLAGTIVVVIALSMLRLVWSIAVTGLKPTLKNYTHQRGLPTGKKAGKQAGPRAPRKRLMAYSPALALSTGLILLWFLRTDLGLMPARDGDSGRHALAETQR